MKKLKNTTAEPSASGQEKTTVQKSSLKSSLQALEKKDKQQQLKRKKALKSRKIPRSSQNTVRYERMYEDGICEVLPGFFSKTFQISDINYQIARRDDQIGIFSRYCEVLNYCDPSLYLQITITNTQITDEEFKDKIFIDFKDDDFDQYRKELNSMLEEKALEGQNRIIRQKYITFAAFSSSYKSAVGHLARYEADLMGLFKSLGCEVRSLSGLERLNLLQKALRPGETFNFSYDQLLESNLTTKNFICPVSFDFSDKSSYGFGDNVGQTIMLRDLPADLSDELISDLADLPINMSINIHINSVEQTDALDLVKRKISFMEQQKIDEQKKAIKSGYDPDMLPHELKYSLAEGEQLLDDLQNKNQRMFKVTLIVNSYADDYDSLADSIFQIMSTARKKNCKMAFLDYQQEDAMNSSLPLGMNYLPVHRTLTTASTAIFIPFTTQELFHTNGSYYGQNAISKGMIFLDRKLLSSPNGMILGTPGSGKSFAAKREIIFTYAKNPNDDVIIIDPEREYTALGEAVGGEIIHISAGSNAHINPMDINMDYSDDESPLFLKSEFVLSVCNLLAGGKTGLSGKQRSIIDRACTIAYKQYFSNPKKYPMPTFKTFNQILLAQPEEDAKSIALSLELYIDGSLSVFSHPTNVDIHKRMVVFDIKDLGKELRTLGMLVVLDQVWNRITRNRQIGKRTWLYVDEMQLLFSNEYSSNYFFELWSRSRKWGAIPTGITQNVETLLLSDYARRMLSNSDFILMLKQSASDRNELAALLNISQRQLDYVTNSDRGTGLLFAEKAIVPFADNFPEHTKLYSLMTTKVEEITPQTDVS